MKFYLRIDNGNFYFIVDDGLSEILNTDIEITEENYNKFFDLQSQGKQFRLKNEFTGVGLFDYIEEYAPQQTANGTTTKVDTTKIIENLQAQISTLKETITNQNNTIETQGKIVNELVLAKLRTI